jgi:hypothetical protein
MSKKHILAVVTIHIDLFVFAELKMKKGKPILAAGILGVLTYLAWLGLDIPNSEQATPVTTPYEVVAETVTPVAPTPAPGRVLARQAVKSRQTVPAAPIAATAVAKAPTEKVEIPMPNVWEGSFVKHDRPINKLECDDIDQPCSPRGRDGVLLVGASFSLIDWKPQLPRILTVGSYGRRTPLLVYK